MKCRSISDLHLGASGAAKVLAKRSESADARRRERVKAIADAATRNLDI